MQLTALLSSATSLALTSAAVVQNRQHTGEVALLGVFDHNTTAAPEPSQL